MFRKIAAALILAASPAAAQDFDVSTALAENGLAATEARLAGAPQTDANTQFALGAVRFLRGIEKTLQLRHRHNATFAAFGIPVLRLPIPPNPNADPFYPALITDLFAAVAVDMEASRTALGRVAADADVALSIDIAGLWFDINQNGTKDRGEELLATVAAALAQRPGEAGLDGAPESLVIRFDTADVAWLRAYTHLISGVAELVLAFDPTEVVAEVAASVEQMNALRGNGQMDRFSFLRSEEGLVDMIAMVYGAINRVPDAARTRAARGHLLAMVAENREFWKAVALEADNEREWIPNATQRSALGFELPPETGTTWLGILGDAEAVLKGDLLVGHWRVEPGAGVNVAKLLENPVAVDLVTWIHGLGLVEHMERGPLVNPDNLRRFERMFAGDALLFMVWLN